MALISAKVLVKAFVDAFVRRIEGSRCVDRFI